MIADFVFEITATAGTGPFTLGGARSADFRRFVQGYSVGDTMPYSVYGGGQFETGKGTLTDANTLARTEVYNGSAGPGVAVDFAAGNKDIFSGINSGSFLNLADVAASNTLADADRLFVLKADGSFASILGSIVKASGTGTGSGTAAPVAPGQVTGLTAGAATDTAQPLSWTAPATGTAPFAYKIEYKRTADSAWTVAATGVTTTSGAVTGLTASTSYDYRVSATNSVNTGLPSATVTKSTAAATPAPVQTITVATPATQTVGTSFPVSGTWTVTQPAALDYRLSDDAAGVWTPAPIGVVINANGTYSFPLTPSSASAGRTISVRDRTTLVAGTSGTYVVNAAAQTMAQRFNTYKTAQVGAQFATTYTGGGGTAPNRYWGVNSFAIGVKSSTDNTTASAPLASDMRFVMLRDDTVITPELMASIMASAPFLPVGVNGVTANNNSGVPAAVVIGNWTTADRTNAYFGLFNAGVNFFIMASGPGRFLPWVLFVADGSYKQITDNGVELAVTVS